MQRHHTFRHALSNATKKKHRTTVRQKAPELNVIYLPLRIEFEDIRKIKISNLAWRLRQEQQ